MSVTPPEASGSALVLSSPTIRTINSLQTELAERLDDSGTVWIDGASVERVDTAGLQLLAAFVRDLQSELRGVEWIGCSDPLKKAAQALGLGSALGFGTPSGSGGASSLGNVSSAGSDKN